MGYELKPEEKIAHGLRRVAGEQTKAIIKNLGEKRPHRRARSIHAARTGTKKMRALLRLVRGRLGKSRYHKEARVLRKVAHASSRLRDAEVLLTMLERICRRHRGKVSEHDFSDFRRTLSRAHKKLLKKTFARVNPLKARLRAARKRIKQWPLKKLGWRDVWPEIETAYSRYASAHANAEQSRTVEKLHAWRRRAKRLWYHLCLLKPVSPKPMGKLLNELEAIGKYLGEDHDLAVFEATAKAENLDPVHLKTLSALIRARRIRLQESAFKLARRLDQGDIFKRPQNP